MEQPRSTAVLDTDLVEGDTFRRSTFKFALSTKAMVEAARALGKATKVTPAALADIVYAKDMLDNWVVPRVTAPGAVMSEDPPLTAEALRATVANVIGRIETPLPPDCGGYGACNMEGHLHRRTAVLSTRAFNNWDAPVYPKNGKMAWAARDCPSCPSKAHQRCQKAGGIFIEKPHPARNAVVVEP